VRRRRRRDDLDGFEHRIADAFEQTLPAPRMIGTMWR
jgi:hypothetical protein